MTTQRGMRRPSSEQTLWGSRLLFLQSDEPVPIAPDAVAEMPSGVEAMAEAVLAESPSVAQRAADMALRQAICCGALSPLRRVLEKHAEHASPSVLATARRSRERLRYRAKRAAKQHRRGGHDGDAAGAALDSAGESGGVYGWMNDFGEYLPFDAVLYRCGKRQSV